MAFAAVKNCGFAIFEISLIKKDGNLLPVEFNSRTIENTKWYKPLLFKRSQEAVERDCCKQYSFT